MERVARVEGRSEADLIREGVQGVIEKYYPATPRIPLFESEDPKLAERVEF